MGLLTERRKRKMRSKIFYGFVGLIAGAITIPIAVFIWPLFLAYFMFNEQEEDSK
jgi:hypothetical protein